jgi:hypothetical protein
VSVSGSTEASPNVRTGIRNEDQEIYLAIETMKIWIL